MGQKSRPVGPETVYIARRLREAKDARGWSYEKLAQESGVPRSTATWALSGKRAIDMQVYLALCRPLGLDPARLMTEAMRAR